jgi:N-methylhydantoinase A
VYEVPERIGYDGRVIRPLDEDRVTAICGDLKKNGISSVAVCYLNSYVNFEHELKTREKIEDALPGTDISLSCEVLPELGEFERMNTTSINAFILPKMKRYISRLEGVLQKKGVASPLHIVQSNGGIMTAKTAVEKCVNTILSGPAGGALSGTILGKAAGFENVITLDMGGTSADIALIYKGNMGFVSEVEVGGYPIKTRSIDVHTIGAGGGSIAWIDSGGALRVGPQSAGADPGPACYGLGGTEPTVTDANVVLGRLNPEFLIGGAMRIDRERGRRTIEEKIARPFGLSLEKAAEGIIQIVNMNMIRGIRYVSVEKGFDPREFALMNFGGGGPLHAVELAKELEIKKILIPRYPGVNSAFGMLMADFRFDYVRTYLQELRAADNPFLVQAFRQLEQHAREEMEKNNVASEKISFLHSVDIRYCGQRHAIEVPIRLDERGGIDRIRESFHELHRRNYGFDVRENEIEMMNVRLAAIGEVVKPALAEIRHRSPATRPAGARMGKRSVFLEGTVREAPVYNRDLLPVGEEIAGPAIVEQLDSTTLIFPDQTARVDGFLNLIITLK